MSEPMTSAEWQKALMAEGVRFRLDQGWTTHNRNHKGPWGPVNGVLIHHTAGTDSLALVRRGTGDLPGPLAHAHLDKLGLVTMVSSGRANHAGSGGQNAFDAVVSESARHPRPGPDAVDGNAHFYGIEIENRGDGKDPYPESQYSQAVKWAVAICRYHGWSAESVIGHKEWTTRKIDPTFDMDLFRSRVKMELKTKEKPENKTEPAKPTEKKKPQAYRDVMETDAVPAPRGHEKDGFWTLETYVRYLADQEHELLMRIEDLRKQVEQLRKGTLS